MHASVLRERRERHLLFALQYNYLIAFPQRDSIDVDAKGRCPTPQRPKASSNTRNETMNSNEDTNHHEKVDHDSWRSALSSTPPPSLRVSMRLFSSPLGTTNDEDVDVECFDVAAPRQPTTTERQLQPGNSSNSNTSIAFEDEEKQSQWNNKSQRSSWDADRHSHSYVQETESEVAHNVNANENNSSHNAAEELVLPCTLTAGDETGTNDDDAVHFDAIGEMMLRLKQSQKLCQNLSIQNAMLMDCLTKSTNAKLGRCAP
jgi:hypothetical protein